MAKRSGRDSLFDRVAPNCGSGVIVILVGLIATAAGWQQESPAALGFGAMLVLLPTVSYLYLARLARRIHMRQSIPGRVFEGESIEVNVSVEGDLPPRFCDLRVSERPGVARGWIRTLTFGDIVDSTEGRERSYRVRCEVPRGRYHASETYMRLGDPFGWFEYRRALKSDNQILVLPRILPMPAEVLRAIGVARMGPGLVASGSGRSSELRSLRPYQTGDPRSRVHWKQTARTGTLIVREDEVEHEGGLIVVLDLDLAEDARGVGRNTLDRATRFVASLVDAAGRQGLRCGFVAGPFPDDRIDIDSDAKMIGLLERLAVLNLAQQPILDDCLLALATTLALPSRLVVVTSSQSLANQDINPRLIALRRLGHDVALAILEDESRPQGQVSIPRGVDISRLSLQMFAGLNG